MTTRREMLVALGTLTALPALAQQGVKMPLIGVLEREPGSENLEAFRQGMRERGYVDGKNIVVEYRYTHGKIAEFPRLAAELVQRKVDLIFAGSTPGARAAQGATNTIPIVFAVVSDPVGAKLIASLPKPGGNATGMTTNNVEIVGKRLSILKEISGGKTARAAMLMDPSDASNVLSLQAALEPARKLGMTLQAFPVKGPEEFDAAFSGMVSARIDALLVTAGVSMNSHAKRIAELAAKSRLPAMYAASEFVDAGGLVSYAASFADNYRRAAAYVDKILKGASPRDLPVEQASTLELTINRKAANALGLNLTSTILLQATRVIE